MPVFPEPAHPPPGFGSPTRPGRGADSRSLPGASAGKPPTPPGLSQWSRYSAAPRDVAARASSRLAKWGITSSRPVIARIRRTAVQPPQHLRRIGSLQRVGAQRAAYPSHDHGGGQAGPGHVADRHAHLPARQGEHAVSACSTCRVRSRSSASSSRSSRRDSAASVIDWMSRSLASTDTGGRASRRPGGHLQPGGTPRNHLTPGIPSVTSFLAAASIAA